MLSETTEDVYKAVSGVFDEQIYMAASRALADFEKFSLLKKKIKKDGKNTVLNMKPSHAFESNHLNKRSIN